MPLKFIAAAVVLAIKVRNRSNESARSPVVASGLDAFEMKPAPINPDWIIEGNPEARCGFQPESENRAVMTAVWDCTAGTFRWNFSWEETVLILEGEVEVTAEDGTVTVLRQGDVGYFASGTWATWRVENYVRKVAVLPKPRSMLIAAMTRLASPRASRASAQWAA
ncbi:cupin domain-containing protein [Rhizobium sp. PAMB 3182]